MAERSYTKARCDRRGTRQRAVGRLTPLRKKVALEGSTGNKAPTQKGDAIGAECGAKRPE